MNSSKNSDVKVKEKIALRKEVIDWLKDQISSSHQIAREIIDENESFASYGLNSMDASALVASLSARQQIKLPAHIGYDQPTLYKLANHVAGMSHRNEQQKKSDSANIQQPISANIERVLSLNTSSQSNLDEIKHKSEKVAILGMACHFPGAKNIDEFWQNLKNEADSITEIPASRWNADVFYTPEITPGKSATKWGGFLADIDQFDYQFFGIAFQEASAIDPQQRIVLEQTWRAFEHAGIAQEEVAGTEVGVFLGVSNNDYAGLPYTDDAPRGPYESTANATSILANRVSYLLDFQGPSVSIDTACSSSLVAIHQAARSVVSGESSLAVAGGVNLILSPDITINFSQSKLMAPDGRCKTFDRSGNGYVRSEGVGIVLLKRLDLAEQDGDRILAVISGSATNNDGRSNGLTAPNGPAQERVLHKALDIARVAPEDIDYVEAHGTGTRLGDPIEVQALSHVFEHRQRPIIVGSVKTNIGHLETAAGIAGLIKTTLMLEHRQLVPNLHFHNRNEDIDWDNIPIQVCTKGLTWPQTNERLRAGVTSIGFGGVNSHVVLEEYPEGRLEKRRQYNKTHKTESIKDRPCHVLSVSARSESALLTQLASYSKHLQTLDDSEFADFCYSANVGRNTFNFRAALVASSGKEMVNTIEQQIANKTSNGYINKVNSNCNLVMMFTGQGAVFAGMGKELYQSNLVFRASIDESEKKSVGILDVSISALLWGEESNLLSNTRYAQPAIFALEVALYEMITSWGIYPDTVMGHSIGEFAAAYAAGVIDLESGLKLTSERGRLMEALCQKGGMLALRSDISNAELLIAPYDLLSVAAHNSPNNIVVAGDLGQLEELKQQLTKDGIQFTALDVEHGFHSPLMQPMLEPFLAVAKEINYQLPKLNIISGVTGVPIEQDVSFSDYWHQHIHAKVDFYGALQAIPSPEQSVLLELGPRQVLRSLAQQSQIAFSGIVSAAAEGQHFWSTICDAVALVHSTKTNIDWRSFDQAFCRTIVPVPNYTFETVRCWNRKIADYKGFVADAKENQTVNSDTNLGFDTIMVSQQEADSEQTKKEVYRILTNSLVVTLGGEASQIDTSRPLTEIGVDSISLISIVHVIGAHFDVKVEVRQLFEELNTLDNITEYILEHSEFKALTPSASSGHRLSGITNNAVAQENTEQQTVQSHALQQIMSHGEGQQASVLENPAVSSTGIERIFNSQLQTMSRLLESQLQVLADSEVATNQTQQLAASGMHITRQPTQTQGQQQKAATDLQPQLSNPSPAAKAVTASSAERTTSSDAKLSASMMNLSVEQNAHLDGLIERFNQKSKKSKEHAQEFRTPLADSRVAARFHAATKELNYSLVCERSQGAHFWDIDGNEYIDMSMSFSAAFFGYNPPFITDAAKQALSSGMQFGPRSKDVGEVSRLLCELTGAERACYVSTGSEANMIAVRLARTVLKKKKVIIFRDIYHGHYDGTLAIVDPLDPDHAIPGVPGLTQGQVEDTVVIDIHDEQAINRIVAKSHEIAAILIEPVLRRQLEFDISDFLKTLRQVTTEHDIALIFDEVLVGFRCHPGGAQAYYGVQADLVTYGKIVGGGFPIGIVAGSRRFMDATDGGYWQFGDHSSPQVETTFVAGTHSKHPVTMAAAKAVLMRLKTAGLSLHNDLSLRLASFADELNQYFEHNAFPIRIVPWCSIFQVKCKDYAEIFVYHLMENGVFYLFEGRLGAISTAHTDEDMSYVKAAFKTAANLMRQGGFWPGVVDQENLNIGLPFPAYSEQPQPEDRTDYSKLLAKVNVHAALTNKLTAAEERIAAEAHGKPEVDAEFSISFFGAYEREYREDKYDLLIDTARYADQQGFVGIWIPERHFHSFGGYSPNPSVLAAALARETHYMQIRAGSSVIPLHHPVRLAEEWAVVDNISNGRVGIAAASGWHPQDFIFAPDNFSQNRQITFDNLEKIQELWKGGTLSCPGGDGNIVEANLYPMPKQSSLPIWITIVKNPDTYYQAGKRGYGVLTNMMGQTPEELHEHITHYHRGRSDAGLDPRQGKVAVLLHTFICQDEDAAKRLAERPFKDYLLTTTNILDSMARSLGKNQEFGKLSPADQEFIIEKSYQRYLETSALIGSPDSCYKIAKQLKHAGVTEFSCFVDFGIAPDLVRQQLANITELKNRFVIHGELQNQDTKGTLEKQEAHGMPLITEESF